jgi:DNA-binding GntR family transcriptional regulator
MTTMVRSKLPNKTEQAYQRIKKLIINGEINGGKLLSENSLCTILHMSRTPIRNALKILETQEFVSIAPKQGILVREVTVKQHTEIYELRQVLEEYILRNFVPVITASDILFLKDRLADQKKARDQANVRAFLNSDIKMHMFFFERYGSLTIKNIMADLREKIYLTALTALGKPGRMDTTLEEHQILVDCIAKGNVEGAIKMLKHHLEKGYSLLP